MQVETVILDNLINSERYGRLVLPYLKPEYFAEPSHRLTFELASRYIQKYNAFPTPAALEIDLDSVGGLPQPIYAGGVETIRSLDGSNVNDDTFKWLVDTTEKWCQDRAIHNALLECIGIVDGEDLKNKKAKGAIPGILQEALAISFDSSIGHDFLEDAEGRFDFYHETQKRLPMGLTYFDRITRGGIPTKTLNVFLAGTNVGKTLAMCHFAGHHLMQGLNVLYITMEMSQERIAERIDANTLDVTMEELSLLTRESYVKKIDRIRGKTKGKLIVKEYPTASAGADNFRHLLNELRIKRNFKPDVIYIDYINICNSSRIKMGGSVNSYTFVKAIAEELRGLAVEFDVPIITATQTNRTGFSSSDVDLVDTAESFGLPQTADFMVAIMGGEELDNLNQFLIKQLKNRYSDPGTLRRFVIGVDKPRQKLYDVEESAQRELHENRNAPPTSVMKPGLPSTPQSKFGDFK